MSHNDLAQAWVDFLAPYPWDWFGTFTFRSSVHPENADKVWRKFVREIDQQLFGASCRKPENGIYWIRASEYQKRGVLHFHALMSGRGANLNDQARRLSWMDRWNELAGFSTIEVPRAGAVVNYVSKYVAKGGEIDLSPSLPHFVAYQGMRMLEVKSCPRS